MKVLMATDGREAAEHAVRVACRVLDLRDGEITVVSVLDPEDRIGGNENAAVDLERSVTILRALGHSASCSLRRGHFVDEILRAAKEVEADVIVLGYEGDGRWIRWLEGSVLDGVLKGWTGSTLIVRLPA
jgi:nucleotide-binding universal stress UspA family protein